MQKTIFWKQRQNGRLPAAYSLTLNHTTMPLFNQRRPRGFHHEYIYSRRDKKRAHDSSRSVADSQSGDGGVTDDARPTRRLFAGADAHARRGAASSPRRGMKVSSGLALLLIVILAVAWKLLLS